MWEKLLFWRRKPEPPKPASTGKITVRATGAAAAGSNAGGRKPKNAVTSEVVMTLAANQAFEEGIKDPAVIRERMNKARLDLRTAYRVMSETGESARFMVGKQSITVRPPL